MRNPYAVLIFSLLVVTSCVNAPKPAPEQVVPVVAPPVAVVEAPKPVPVPLVLKETISFADGIVDRVVSYEYAEGSLDFTSKTSRKLSQPDPVERVLRAFSADGKIAGQKTLDAAGAIVSESIFEYNAAGYLVRETVRDGKATVQSTSEWKYNASNKKISWVVLNASGNVLAQTDYVYDAKGNLKQIAMSKGGGIATGTAEYEVNKDGQLESLTYYTPQKSVERKTAYLWKDGKIAEETVYRAEGRIERKYRYTYGTNGEILKRIMSDASGTDREVSVYEYKIVMR